jgi:hypothetical protein
MGVETFTARTVLSVAATSLVAAVAACGGGASPSTSPTAHASATPTSPATSHPATAAGYVIDTSQLPSGSQTWQQIADGLLNNVPNSHQRGWQNPGNSQRVEVDVLVESSAAGAQSDYATWHTDIMQKLSSPSTADCPSGMSGAASCDEATGMTSDGKSQCTITWVDGAALAAVIMVDASGTVDQSYCEHVGVAEDDQISSVGQ